MSLAIPHQNLRTYQFTWPIIRSRFLINSVAVIGRPGAEIKLEGWAVGHSPA
jgi:hypothetical protein